MSSLKEYFNRILEHVKSKYSDETEGHKEIWSEYQNEQDVAIDYKGRQIFELLQNADDASETANLRKILIVFDDGILKVSNNGTPFTEDSFDSITYRGMSPKRGQESSTGEKGLGFRSYLTWSTDLTIESGGEKVSFSKEYAECFLKELFEEHPIVEEKYHALQNKSYKDAPEYSIAILRIPYVQDNYTGCDNGYDTTVSLTLKEDSAANDVSLQLKEITPQTLVFMKYIDEIEIREGASIRILSKELENDKVVVTEWINDEQKEKHCWNINRKKGVIKSENGEYRNYELTIAWDDNLSDTENTLYSYFKTAIRFPFPFLVNGSFQLISNRNLLQDTFYNRELIDYLIELIVETAIKIGEKTWGYTALKLLCAEFSSISDYLFRRTEFESKLKDRVWNSKIFPTVNNDYISILDKPVYYEGFNSTILKGNDVRRLLLPCPDQKIATIYLLPKFDEFKYSVDELASIIHSRILQLSQFGFENYVKLLELFRKSFPTPNFDNLPYLLINENDEAIPWNSKIVAKDNDMQITIPTELSYSFVHTNLLNESKRHLNTFYSSFLAYYGIKLFSCEKIANDIIEYYNYKKQLSRDDIEHLHRTLFSLYNEDDSIKIIRYPQAFTKDKEGRFRATNELHYGKEYDCELTDILFNYDASLLLASRETFGFDEGIDQKRVIQYFNWLHVSKWPRRIKFNIERHDHPLFSYKKQVFKKLDYEKVGRNLDMHSYQEFGNKVQYCIGEVTTIKSIDDILSCNNPETILAWVIKDMELRKLLEDDCEPSSSNIRVAIYKKQYYRDIYGEVICSFIRWKISQTPWLTCATGNRVKPSICTTSNTITDDFNPYIEKPKVDTKNAVFKKYLAKGSVLQTAYTLVGVNARISDFDSETIYQILNKLPEKDPNGEKAKSIYRELTNNYDIDSIENTGSEYLNFRRKGQVLCKKDQKTSYCSYEEAYYVNNRQYGDSIIRQFNTIMIDPRLNSENIKGIFGVAKMEFDAFQIIDNPRLHSLNNEFEQEIESFKPYVYIFRKDKDQDEKDKSKIKDAKFKLVSSLSYSFSKGEKNYNASLGDYEFFSDSTNKRIYICAPDNIFSFETLHHDVLFGTAIAEAFSALFNIDTMAQIRELFGQSVSGRNDIIREYFNDNQLIELKRTKELLGMTSDYRLSFWNSFVRCFPDKSLEKENYEENELIEELHLLFPNFSDAINKVNEGLIDDDAAFDSNLDVVRSIIELLRTSKISLEQFNKYVSPSISIDKVYKEDFKKMVVKNKSIIEAKIYEQLCHSHNLSEQKDFKAMVNRYNQMSHSIPVDVDYDVVADYYSQLKMDFNIEKDFGATFYDLDKIYNDNLQLIKKEVGENITEKAIIEYVNASSNRLSLLYFSEGVSYLIELIKQEFQPQKSISIITNAPIQVAGHSVSYSSIKDIVKQIDNANINIDDEDVSVISIHKPQEHSSVHNPNGRGGNGNRHWDSSRRVEKEYGCIGEKLVFDYLKKKHNCDVKWVSANAAECGENPLESTDGLGYDIEYTEKGKRTKYVEVKTTQSNSDIILISPNEVRKGEELKEDFELFIVRDIKSSRPYVEIIKAPFKYTKGCSFNNNDRFLIEIGEYALRFEKE